MKMRWKSFLFLVAVFFLIVISSNARAQSIDTRFRLAEGSRCTDGGRYWKEIDSETGEVIGEHSTINEVNWCLGEDNLPGGDDCCPLDRSCLDDPSTDTPDFRCEIIVSPEFTLLSCEDYNLTNYQYYVAETGYDKSIQYFCENESAGIGNSGTIYVEEEDRTITTIEKCVWIGSESSGECVLDSRSYESISHGEDPFLFNCTKDFSKEVLTGNRINYSWTATPEWNENFDWENACDYGGEDLNEEQCKEVKASAGDCVPGSKIIKLSIAKLPFFNLGNFIASSLIIVIIYFSLIKKRK